MTVDAEVIKLIQAELAPYATKTYVDAEIKKALAGLPTTPVPPIIVPPIVTPPAGTPADAMAGLILRHEWEFSTHPSQSGWYVYDNSSGPNGELGYNTPRNVEIIADPSTSNGFFMRCWVKREPYAGKAFTSVMMENSGVRIGAGQAFYLETRLRWQSYPGFWGGVWLFAYPGAPYEIDVMETVNTLGPTCTTHNPNSPTFALRPTNDGGWHTYGCRVDSTGLRWWMDGVLVRTVNDPGLGAAFVNANMFPKVQHLVGGNWPNSDAGKVVPDASVVFPKWMDVDYIRISRP